MNRSVLAAVAAASLVAVVAPSAGAAPTTGPLTRAGCATASGHDARCFAEYRAVHQPAGTRIAPPAGLSPAEIASAYALSGDGGARRAVAVLGAVGGPNARGD